MKKGFTLIELMAVVVIISLVCLLTFPNIVNQIKKSKDANKDNVEKVVISAAKRYVNDNIDKYSEDGQYCISVQDLIDNDYLKEDIVNDEDNDINSYSVQYSSFKNEFQIKNECIQNLIPYQQLEYIEGVGDSFIDTGVVASINITLEARAQATYDSSVGNTGRSGMVLSANQGWFTFGDYGFGLLVAFFSKTSREGATIPFDTDWHVYYISNGEQRIDDVKSNVEVTSNYPTNLNLYLFNLNKNYSGKMNSGQRMSYIKIWEDNLLIRDYVPVLDDNGVACLYDKVNDKLYYNQGTDEFLYE